jgi:hypothetical protein
MVHAKVVNTHRPLESTTAVASWNAFSISGLPAVSLGSVLTGMPNTSLETM